MILFLKDWHKRHPEAIIDLKTTNVSFVRMAGLYKKMGIKNHAFLLALHNPLLQGIDPYAEDLTREQKIMIAAECKVNPWYYFREIMRVPPPAGNDVIMFRANRANISTLWLAFNHITGYLIQPRQTGKTLTSSGLNSYMINIAATNTDLSFLTKDEKLRTNTSIQVRDLIELIPSYLQLLSKKDIRNNERVTVSAVGNSLNLYIAKASRRLADNLGRGMSTPIISVDELGYLSNIDVTLPVLLAAAT